MSEEARNVAILTEAYRHWSDSRGASVDYWMSLCDQDIAFGSLAESEPSVPYMVSYNRRDDLAQYFAGLGRDWEMIEFRPEHFVAQGDRVVMLGRCSWRAKASGQAVATPIAASFRLKDGKIVEYFEYFDTAQIRDALTAPPVTVAV